MASAFAGNSGLSRAGEHLPYGNGECQVMQDIDRHSRPICQFGHHSSRETDRCARPTTWPAARRRFRSRSLNFYYGAKQALSDVSLTIPQHCVTALIGPSGCGKSTFLRCLNRMNDMIDGTRVEGEITARRPRHPRPEGRRRRAAQARRHGVPEVEPVSQVDLRERGVRPARGRRPRQVRAVRDRREVARSAPRCGTK